MTVPQTFATWTVIETIVSIAGLVGVLVLRRAGWMRRDEYRSHAVSSRQTDSPDNRTSGNLDDSGLETGYWKLGTGYRRLGASEARRG